MDRDIPICQSCAMPMTLEEDFGTNKDGSKSFEYCHNCYVNGKFVKPDLTLDEQVVRLTKMAVDEMYMKFDEAKIMAKKILPVLKRWK